ncbi:hypothetical protein O9992_21935 [Vibrio lentus]|nr:hypothetical protein [Vibrio lentus]
MSEHKTLDLSSHNINTSGTVSSDIYQIGDSVVRVAPQSVLQFTGAKSIALNPASSQIVLLTANDVVMQIDSSSRNASDNQW